MGRKGGEDAGASVGAGAGGGGAKLTRKPSKLKRALSRLKSAGSGSGARRGPGDLPDLPAPAAASSTAAAAAARRPQLDGPLDRGMSRGLSTGLQDFAASTAARIKMFEEGSFNLEAGLGSLTEKGLENLRGDLAALDAEVLENLRRAVHAQYSAFIRATPGILALEGDVAQLRNLLQSLNQLTQGLQEVSAAAAQLQRRSASDAACAPATPARSGAEHAWRESGDGAKWAQSVDELDVAIAERRLPDALSLLRKLEKLQQRAEAGGGSGAGEGGGGGASGDSSAATPAQQQARAQLLQDEVEARRAALVPLAEQPIAQPTASPADIRAAAALLADLAGRQHAQRVVLEAYSARLRRQQGALLKPANSGGADADGSDYAAALGQKLVLAVGQAADDCAAVFGRTEGGGRADLAAVRLVWALQETERACHLLRKHALVPFAAPAGLAAAARCSLTFLSYCAALEASHALRLAPLVHRELWPVLEQVLLKRVRKSGEALRRSAYTEVDLLAAGSGSPPPADLGAWEGLAAVFPSADFLVDEVEGVARDLAAVHTPRAAAAVRRAVADLFQGYTAALAAALNRGLKYAASEEAQERLAQGVEVAMEAATVLVERLLPDATAQLAGLYGDMCGPALGDHLVRMGESLGMTTVPLTPGGHPAVLGDGYGGGPGAVEGPVGNGSTSVDGGAGAAGAAGGGDTGAGAAGEPLAADESSEEVRYRTTSDE